MEGEYTVRTEVFEGPLDVLLQLVEKRKLFINDIALSQVADDYVVFTQRMDNLPIDETANFVVIAATLILIKSRSLLPQMDLTGDEEQTIEELQHRLKLYKQIKELSIHVEDGFGKNIIFSRHQRKIANHASVFSPDTNTTVNDLHSAVTSVLGKVPKKEKVPEAVLRTVVSLEETIDSLIDRVTSGLTLSFRDFSGHGADRGERVNIIVSFLAVLELVKQGSLSAHQDDSFSDIAIENRHIATPTYQ